MEQINHQRIPLFLRKIRQALWVLRGKTLAILGVAFKPGTDDLREAPSLKIIDGLLQEGAVLRVYDPQALPGLQGLFPERAGQLVYCPSAYDAAEGADALLLLTEWDEFRQLDLARLHDLMKVPVVVDGRNLYDPEQMRQLGFEYLCFGRPGAVSLSVGTVGPSEPTATRQN